MILRKETKTILFAALRFFEQLPTVPWTMERIHSESTAHIIFWSTRTRVTFSVHCEQHTKKTKILETRVFILELWKFVSVEKRLLQGHRCHLVSPTCKLFSGEVEVILPGSGYYVRLRSTYSLEATFCQS